jgi:hypothetical protein
MRKPRRYVSQAKPPDGPFRDSALAPVWVEADEVRTFKLWWDTLAEPDRTARRAFLHGLERADAAWAPVYRRLVDGLKAARALLRDRQKEAERSRAENEELRRHLEQAIDRATEAEERVRHLTTPVRREYD